MQDSGSRSCQLVVQAGAGAEGLADLGAVDIGLLGDGLGALCPDVGGIAVNVIGGGRSIIV
jgi:hypothetical protein